MPTFYPSLREETILALNVVVQNLEQDSNYLDNTDCPYSDPIKNFFRKKISVSGSNIVVDVFEKAEGETDLDKIREQIVAVINDLEDFGRKLTIADSTDKMGYFRTKTALIEKLVNMQERTFNIKEINDFRNTLLGFMNEVLTKDQVTQLMQRLDGILGTKNDDLL